MRDSTFYPGALEKGLRSERALTLATAEMWLKAAVKKYQATAPHLATWLEQNIAEGFTISHPVENPSVHKKFFTNLLPRVYIFLTRVPYNLGGK